MKNILITIPSIFGVVGLLFYGLFNGKPSEIGRLTFFAGLLVLLLHVAK